jgi:hypothetical protein
MAGIPEKIPSPWFTNVAGAGQPGGPGGPGGSSPPAQHAGYELYVRQAPAYSELLAVIPRYMSLQFSKQLNDKGAGTVVLSLDDVFWLNETLAVAQPAAPFLAGSLSSASAAATSYDAPVTVTSPGSSAVTVIAGCSGSNTPVSCSDTEGNIYFCMPVNLLGANAYFEASGAASVTGWTSFGGTLTAVTAYSGAPLPYAALLQATSTAVAGMVGTAWAASASAKYLITGLVYSPAATTVEIGVDWLNSGTFVSDSYATVSVDAGWTALGTVVTCPSSGVNEAATVCGMTAPSELQELMVTALAAQPAAALQIFQAMGANELSASYDSVTVNFAASDTQQTSIMVLSGASLNAQGPPDISAYSSGTSGTPGTGPRTPAQAGELALWVVQDATAGGTGAAPPGWTQLAQVSGASVITTVYYQVTSTTAALSPATAITSAAWQAALVSLEGATAPPAVDIFNGEHLWQVYKDGVCVFEFFGETITEQLVDQSEQRTITVTGPGTITCLSWAAAMPPGFPDIVFKTDAIQDGFAEINTAGQYEVDTSLWNVISPAADVTLNPAGTLQLTASTTTTFCGASPYDVTNSLFSAQITPLGQGTSSATSSGTTTTVPALDGSQITQMYLQSNANASDYLLMGVTAAGMYCQLGDVTGGNQTKSLGAYDPVNQLYWEIAHAYSDDGVTQTVSFYTSPDGETWNLVWEVEPQWVPDNVTVFFACYYDANSSQTMGVTNVNGNVVTPSSSGNIYFGEPIMGVWYDIFSAAQERGTIPFVTTTLSTETDSFGNPWTDSESVQIQNGTDLYSLLQSHTAIVNASFIMQPGFVLQVGLPEPGQITLGTDRSQTVVIREGWDQQSKQYVRDRSQIANLVGAVNSDGTTISASNEPSILTWGQREGWVQTAVQVDPVSMLIAAEASVEQTASEVESYTITIQPDLAGARPFRDFNVGDFIGLESPFSAGTLVPELIGGDVEDEGTGDVEDEGTGDVLSEGATYNPYPVLPASSVVDAIQVVAIAIAVDAQGAVTCELTVNTYLQWLQEQLQYLVNKMGGQFINSLGTTPVTSGSNTPTQLPTVFAPSMNNLTSANTTGVTNGAPLVYNSTSGQWQPAGTPDANTGSQVTAASPNVQTLHYTTTTPQPGTLLASISPVPVTDAPGNSALPGVVSYGSTESQTIQLYQGILSVGTGATQIQMNAGISQPVNVTALVAGTLEVATTLNTDDSSETIPGLLGALLLGTGTATKMTTVVSSPVGTGSGAAILLEAQNDGATDEPVLTFGSVTEPDGTTLVFAPVLTVTPYAMLLYGGTPGLVVVTYTGTTTWTAPSGVTSVKAECWGAGGGGGGAATTGGGGGGAGGNYAANPSVTVIPGNPYAVDCGSGGTGGSGTGIGSAGGASSFNSFSVVAEPGNGGKANYGVGGTPGSGDTGTVVHTGGSGGDGGYQVANGGGGGGGSSAGTSSGGNAGQSRYTSPSPDGGAGGAAPSGGGAGGEGGQANGVGGSGHSGSTPGGGGGGGGCVSSGTKPGGNGGHGQVRLTYTPSGAAPAIQMSVAAASGTDQFGSAYGTGLAVSQVTALVSGTPETWHSLGSLGVSGMTVNQGRYRMLPDGDVEINFSFTTTAAVSAQFASFANTLPAAYQPLQEQGIGVGASGSAWTISSTRLFSLLVTTSGNVQVSMPAIASGISGGCNFRFPVN